MKITIVVHNYHDASQEYDIVVAQVARALRKNGNSVNILGVRADLKKLISGLNRRKPDLIT